MDKDLILEERRKKPNVLWQIASFVPGLLLTGIMTAVAYLLAGFPGLKVMGALGVALFLGLAVRAAVGLPEAAERGVDFSAKTLLRLGIVLLGVRLNFTLIGEAGLMVLLLDLSVILFGIFVIERLGWALGVSRSLRLSLAVGSSICGASAIVAAAPVVRAKKDEISVSVATVSVLGTLGVLGYTVLGAALELNVMAYGLMTGATLQEVGQVLAAGFALGPQAGDLATITKLTRVALLAPVLLIVGALLFRWDSRRVDQESEAGTIAADQAVRPPLLPAFLFGFLLVGAVNTFGLIPTRLTEWMQTASLILTAAAMAGIGLSVDFRALRNIGANAMILGTAGFALIVGLAAIYMGLLLY
jgi:uncharacterized integral membrane protein (TIGR00698 family)